MPKVKFTTNIDEEILKEIKIAAIEESRPVNLIIEEQLKNYLNKKENENMKKEITNMNLGELMNLDNEILTEEELAELEEHELVTGFETLGASGRHVGHAWYSVELEDASIDVFCKF